MEGTVWPQCRSLLVSRASFLEVPERNRFDTTTRLPLPWALVSDHKELNLKCDLLLHKSKMTASVGRPRVNILLRIKMQERGIKGKFYCDIWANYLAQTLCLEKSSQRASLREGESN